MRLLPVPPLIAACGDIILFGKDNSDTDTAFTSPDCGDDVNSPFLGENLVWNREDSVRIERQNLCAEADIYGRMCIAAGENGRRKKIADDHFSMESGNPNYDLYLHYEGLQEILDADEYLPTCIEVWDSKGFSYSLDFDLYGNIEETITDDEDEFEDMGQCPC